MARDYTETVDPTQETDEERAFRLKNNMTMKQAKLAISNANTPEEYQALLKLFKLTGASEKTKWTPEILMEQVTNYLILCGNDKLRPNIQGLANYLGVTSRTLQLWRTKPTTTELGEIITKFVDFVINNHIQLIESNPTAHIHMLKAYGFGNQQTITLNTESQNQEEDIDEQISRLGLDGE